MATTPKKTTGTKGGMGSKARANLKKTTKTAAGAQQYIAGGMDMESNHAALNRARQAVEDSSLSLSQKAKATRLLYAASDANASNIIKGITKDPSSFDIHDDWEKRWVKDADKWEKKLKIAGFSKGGMAKKKKK